MEAASPGLFGQMITVALLMRHRILSQLAAHGLSVLKALPPLVIADQHVKWIVRAVEDSGISAANCSQHGPCLSTMLQPIPAI